MLSRRLVETSRLAIATIAFLAAASSAVAASWDVEVGGGAVFYTPSLPTIPRGSSDTVVEPLVEVSLARGISSRLAARATIGYAQRTETTWQSADGIGSAELPMPALFSAFVSLETPLFRGRITPSAAIGGGILVFDDLDEKVTFDWGSHEETVSFALERRTDPSLLFDLGAQTAVTSGLHLIVRYRLVSVFAGDEIDTLDRLTLSARLPL